VEKRSKRKAIKIVQRFIHQYQPPIECAHKWGPAELQQMSAGLLRLRTCQFCEMVTGSLI
jgi:hypothetical protein